MRMSLEDSVAELLSLPEEEKRELARIAIRHLKAKLAHERREQEKGARKS